MWQIVRQFYIVLHLVLGDLRVGHALPQNQIGLRHITNTVENPVISNLKLKVNLSNASSTGKPAMLTVSTYSTSSNWDSRTTILQTSLTHPTKDDIMKAYNKPVIFPTTTPSNKLNTSTKKTNNGNVSFRNPISSLNAKTEVRPCQKIVAGALCEDDADYPVEVARTIFKDDKFKSQYSAYFSAESAMPKHDVIHTKIIGTDTKDVINTRFDSSSSDGTPICPTQENIKFFAPTKLVDKNNNWKHILQPGRPNNLSQVIPVEICVNANGPCDLLSSLTTGYESKCVQKFSFRKLVWVADDKEHGVDEFKVPSCCSCRYSTDADLIATRMMSNPKHNQKGSV